MDTKGRSMNVITWQPGHEGKGIVDQNGSVHIWVDGEDYDFHHQYVEANPQVESPKAYFLVDPKGSVSLDLWSRHPEYHPLLETILDADGHLHEDKSNHWEF
jgi:hypothetical protein